MTEEKLRLRYIEDTDKILQVWIRFPFVICIVFDTKGKLKELIIDEDEYIRQS